jgi:hypothetical protein
MRRVLAVGVLALTGCATAVYTPPVDRTGIASSDRTYQASVDATWGALVDFASSRFFSIQHVEKASGLMSLSFSASPVELYVDCGTITVSGAQQGSPEPYVRYLERSFGARLEGRANVLARASGADASSVRVTARYTFTVPGSPGSSAQVFSFDTGSGQTLQVANPLVGTLPFRTCRPTGRIEMMILDGVARSMSPQPK